MATAIVPEEELAQAGRLAPFEQTTCCIVGGGPGGMMLALLLARRGVQVTLLEAHKDFDREFRGDTLHPSILEILDQIGLAEPLHRLRHNKIYGPTLQVAGGSFSPVDFRRLKTRFPYIMLIPQTMFLEFLAAEGKKYPNFRLRMVANVGELIEGERGVRGVRYHSTDGWHEVGARLTIGADGRFSKVRQLAGFAPIKTSPPMDILWFRLPHLPGDEHSDRVMAGLEKGGFWQCSTESTTGRSATYSPRGSTSRCALRGWKRFGNPLLRSSRASRSMSRLSKYGISVRCSQWSRAGVRSGTSRGCC